MNSTPRVYAGRLSGMMVRDPDGDPIGRIRDVVVALRPDGTNSRALGLIIQMTDKRRIFMPMLRIASVEPNEVLLNTGSVSMRQFRARPGETCVLAELVGSRVQVLDPDFEHLHGQPQEVIDIALERNRNRDWMLTRIAVRPVRTGFSLGRKRPVIEVPWEYVEGLETSAGAPLGSDAALIASFDGMRPADIAQRLHKLPPARLRQVALSLHDDLLADVLQELPDDHQADIIRELALERAADVLGEMDPDDAADVLSELDEHRADVLLEMMEPEDQKALRHLMTFQPDTVGGLMTPEAIILQPSATVAEALAHARNPDLPITLSSMVFVVRPPTAVPTGKYLGCVHMQKLLREMPSTQIGGILDPDLPPLYPWDSDETAARYFATYNLVTGAVVDDKNHLLGAVCVDDLLDHILPEDWREGGLRPEVNNG